VTLFYSDQHKGQTPGCILTLNNCSNDADSRKDVHFGMYY